jgi:hypothetical protein
MGLAMRVENTPQYPYITQALPMNSKDLVYQVGNK